MRRSPFFTSVLPAILIALLAAGPTSSAPTAFPVVSPADTGRIERGLRHFYSLYTSRDYDALYARAAPRVRNGGLTKSDFRRFMRKKRKRLGPVRSVQVDVPERAPESEAVRATARVQYAKGERVEQWRLVVQNDTVRWRSFRTTGRPESSRSNGAASKAPSASKAPVTVGAPVPTFKVRGLRDSTRTVGPTDFEGQYVLLNLWATWCAPCVEKLPQLRKAARRYDDLAILNISFDRRRSDVTSFLRKQAVPGVHTFAGLQSLRGELAARLGVDGRPHTILAGPAGKVVAGERRLERTGMLSVLRNELQSLPDG